MGKIDTFDLSDLKWPQMTSEVSQIAGLLEGYETLLDGSDLKNGEIDTFDLCDLNWPLRDGWGHPFNSIWGHLRSSVIEVTMKNVSSITFW